MSPAPGRFAGLRRLPLSLSLGKSSGVVVPPVFGAVGRAYAWSSSGTWGSSPTSPTTARGSSDGPTGPSTHAGPTTEHLFSLMASSSLMAGSGGGAGGALCGREEESGLQGVGEDEEDEESVPFGLWS